MYCWFVDTPSSDSWINQQKTGEKVIYNILPEHCKIFRNPNYPRYLCPDLVCAHSVLIVILVAGENALWKSFTPMHPLCPWNLSPLPSIPSATRPFRQQRITISRHRIVVGPLFTLTSWMCYCEVPKCPANNDVQQKSVVIICLWTACANEVVDGVIVVIVDALAGWPAE